MIEPALFHVEETLSTNDDLKKAVSRTENKLFICETADKQRLGRGRSGKSFVSDKGGIYFSFTLPLSGKEKNIPFLTLLTGLVVCLEIRKVTCLDVKIKWPNDLYLNGRKICGILTELISAGEKITAIAGVGINNEKTDFPQELKDSAACLVDFGAVIEDKDAFIKAVTQKVYSLVYEENALDCTDKYAALIRELSYSVGKDCEYCGRTGKILDINDDGSVKIEFDDGIRDVFSGVVT